jgi:hypothetical protein
MIRRQVLSTLAAACLLASALVSCHAPPPPPPPPPPPLPVPPPFVPPPPKVVSGRWSFAVTENSCVAHAWNSNVSLGLHIGSDHRVELSVAGRAVRLMVARSGRRARFRFEGPAGSWTLPARSTRYRAVLAVLPLSKTSANHVLALLGGGRLRTEIGTAYVLVMRLPDSDVAGREWFDCVRNELGHVTPST